MKTAERTCERKRRKGQTIRSGRAGTGRKASARMQKRFRAYGKIGREGGGGRKKRRKANTGISKKRI